MSDLTIEQAIYEVPVNGKPRLLGQSVGFLEQWLPEAEWLCIGFGKRPPGMACPAAVFARPFADDRVAVVQVADRSVPGAASLGPLGFRLLLVAQGLRSLDGGSVPGGRPVSTHLGSASRSAVARLADGTRAAADRRTDSRDLEE